jgi:hypothetical protein
MPDDTTHGWFWVGVCTMESYKASPMPEIMHWHLVLQTCLELSQTKLATVFRTLVAVQQA